MSISRLFIFTFLTIISFQLSAQVAINETNSTPDQSAMLDVQSTDKGVLVPRLTTRQREMISNPANGLLVWDSDTASFWFHNQDKWIELIDRNNSPWNTNSSDDIYTVGSKVGIGTSNPQYPVHIDENGGGRKLAVEYNPGAIPDSFEGLGGDSNIGLSFYAGSIFNGPGMRLTPDLRLGIGQGVTPASRLHVLSSGGIPAFKVQYDVQAPNPDITAFMIHTNSGVSIGDENTPPSEGLAVKGDIHPSGDISSTSSMTIETTDQFSGLTLKGATSDLSLDGTGIYGNAPSNIIMQSTQKLNKVEINDLGIATVSEEDIQIETTGLNKSITLRAGTTNIKVDKDGGITITTNGNDINVNSNGGDIAFDALDGDFSVEAKNFTMMIQDSMEVISDLINLTSADYLNLNAHNSILDINEELTVLSNTIDIFGYNTYKLNSSLIELNSLGTFEAARRGDPVQTPNTINGTIGNGSPSVQIGLAPIFPAARKREKR